MRNAEENTQTSLEDKFPLLEIDTELTKVMPPDEVLELVNACVSLSGYSRNDLRNAFFRALSISALDVYVDADQRCKVAIDIIVNGLENRFPDKTKLEYEWKGESSNLSEVKVIDKYGNGLFIEYCVHGPTDLELNGERTLIEPNAPEVQDAPVVPDTPEIHGATDIDVAPKAHNVLEIQDASEFADGSEINDAPPIPKAPVIPDTPDDSGAIEVYDAPEVQDAPKVDSAPAIPDAQVLNTPEEIGTPEDVNALEIDSAKEDADTPAILDAPEILYAPEVDSIQVPNAPEDGLAPEESGAVEVANTPEIPSIPETHEACDVDGPTEISGASAIPELVLSSPSPAKKRTRKASEASNNSMILAEILQELKEIKALLKDKQ